MRRAYSLCLVPFLLATSAEAQIYKCEAADGGVSYSQIPCPEEKSEPVRSVTSSRSAPADCRWASQFASEVGRRMRAGKDSASLFELYGGVDSVSNGTVNIINYVYRFRSDDSIGVERIAALAGNMCKAGSLGDVRCESLPYGKDPTGKRCNPDEEEAAAIVAAVGNGTTALGTNRPPAQQEPASSRSNRIVTNADSAADTAKTQACKKRYRDQIDAIDAEMRSGYDSSQGESYRERLRVLTTRLREC